MNTPFIELEHQQFHKSTEKIGGDVFLKKRSHTHGRISAVLSDGLGSGIKAHVLANLTARMGHTFLSSNMDIRRSAETIMNSLPVCRERRISYATFTMIDSDPTGTTSIIEYDNPPILLLRNNRSMPIDKREIILNRKRAFKKEILYYSTLKLYHGDRLLFFSDGVTQSGMGSAANPLGWRKSQVEAFVEKTLSKTPEISARALAEAITRRALYNDGNAARDDITCGSLFVRTPRKLLLVSGPSMHITEDTRMADICRTYSGKKVICGGTTAKIIADRWGSPLTLNIMNRTDTVPPSSHLPGADLVTEGILTLTKTAEYLAAYPAISPSPRDPAGALTTLLMESDEVNFLVGTKINEAHQDPAMPVEVGIRRNIIRRIMSILQERHLKKTTVEFI
jgi:hypothetical protein